MVLGERILSAGIRERVEPRAACRPRTCGPGRARRCCARTRDARGADLSLWTTRTSEFRALDHRITIDRLGEARFFTISECFYVIRDFMCTFSHETCQITTSLSRRLRDSSFSFRADGSTAMPRNSDRQGLGVVLLVRACAGTGACGRNAVPHKSSEDGPRAARHGP